MPTNYTTKQAADKLQVSPNTLRNWSKQYGEQLDPSARPDAKPERQFSELDLKKLTYIKQLRKESMEQPAILERMKETKFAADEVLAPSALQATADTTSALIAQTSPDVTTATPSVIVAIDDLRNEFRAEIEALRLNSMDARQTQRDYVHGVAVGAIGALVFVMFLLLLFLVRHYL